jgi:hypothetical protein
LYSNFFFKLNRLRSLFDNNSLQQQGLGANKSPPKNKSFADIPLSTSFGGRDVLTDVESTMPVIHRLVDRLDQKMSNMERPLPKGKNF